MKAINRANDKIRKRAEAARVPLWQIADALGVCEVTLSRWLRHELDAAKAKAFNEAIDRIIEGRE